MILLQKTQHAANKKEKKNKNEMEVFWKQFNAIYCINLKERTDRKNAASIVFEKCNVKVEFHEACRDASGNGVKGCWKEHQACMRDAYAKGYENVVIFEDDIELASLILPSTLIQSQVTRFLQTNKRWELFFLGACPNIFFENHGPENGYANIKRVNSLCAHAYIATRTWMSKFLSLDYDVLGTAVDVIYMMNKNAFAVFPTWFNQSTSPSNINAPSYFSLVVAKKIASFKNEYTYRTSIPLVYIITGLFVIMFLLLCLMMFR